MPSEHLTDLLNRKHDQNHRSTKTNGSFLIIAGRLSFFKWAASPILPTSTNCTLSAPVLASGSAPRISALSANGR